MPIRSWCIVALVLSPSISSPAVAAQTEKYRPDAAGYPCDVQAKLAIASADGGFAIAPRRQSEPNKAPSTPAFPTIALGHALQIDRAIVDRVSQPFVEATDANDR
jgi:hypothetical protein